MTNRPGSPRRDEDDDDLLDALQRDDALHAANGAVVAGLLGAALGAGLGWLVSRRAVGAPSRPADGGAAAGDHAHHAADDVLVAAHRAAAALEQSRADVEQQVERVLRDLRRAVRRAARRVG